MMKRSMGWKITPNGKVVTCIACSWWAPLIGDDIDAAAKEFENHVCIEHPPVRDKRE